jgi:CRP-like cAMP-binding protein
VKFLNFKLGKSKGLPYIYEGVKMSENALKTFKAGEWLFTEGKEGYFIYKLLKGRVSIYRSGKKINELEINKGDRPKMLGMMALITDDNEHTASVKTETEVEVEKVYINIRELIKNKVPENIKKEIDIMIKTISIIDRIKSLQGMLSELPPVTFKIPDGISEDASMVMEDLASLYKAVRQ